MTRRLGALLLALIVCTMMGSIQSVAAAPRTAATDTRTMTVGGYQRTYHVHLPPTYTGTTPMPLVVALHGSYSSGTGMAGLTHFNTIADQNGVIAVYPDALNGVWNSDRTAPQDDFAFIASMIQQMHSTLPQDGFAFIASMIQQMHSTLAINSHRTYLGIGQEDGRRSGRYLLAANHRP